MAITIYEVVSALCTLIALICASAVLITGILTFTIPHFLWFTETQVPTFAGIVAGFVTIPTMLRIKTSKSSPHIDKIFGYTVCYQRLAILVCVALHSSASIVTLITAVTTKCLCKKLLKLMQNYHCKLHAKELIDNIQLSLQCCGARKYRDWYKIDWTKSNFDVNDAHANTNVFYEMLKRDTDEYPDLSTIRTDHVPYSCCARKAMAPCVHQSLIHYGTHTINKIGCAKKLLHVVQTILYTQFVIYVLCLLLEVLVLLLLKPIIDTLECKKCKATITESKYLREQSFSKFENENRAEIVPSSHTELKFSSQHNRDDDANNTHS